MHPAHEACYDRGIIPLTGGNTAGVPLLCFFSLYDRLTAVGYRTMHLAHEACYDRGIIPTAGVNPVGVPFYAFFSLYGRIFLTDGGGGGPQPLHNLGTSTIVSLELQPWWSVTLP